MRPTALLRASEDGDTELVRKLLREQPDIDIDMRDKKVGRSPLLEAVIGGHLDTVAVLLAAHADVEARDKIVKYTALAWAVEQNEPAIVRMLLDHGADPEGRSGDFDDTPLVLATKRGHEEIAGILREAGATTAEAEPIPELPVLPWPAVVPGRPGYTDPVAVVRGFIVQMAQWERNATLTSFKQRDDLAAAYLTERVRTYRPHSFGTPQQFDEHETLHAIDHPKPGRCELLVRDPVGHPLRSDRLYTVLKKRGEWRLDSLKSRLLGTERWDRQLL